MGQALQPQVICKSGIGEASECLGHVIVIDVLRAFTTAAYAFERGLKRIILVGTSEEAFGLKQRYPNSILVGEQDGKQLDGFDYGNSPEAILKLDLRNKTMILRSTSGTQGVIQAKNASKIYLGSLVVAKATIRAVQKAGAEVVSILAMGSPGHRGEEDLACQEYMQGLILEQDIIRTKIVDGVIRSRAGQRALDPAAYWISPGDLECAIQIDKFDFAMPVVREDGLYVAYPER